ncbi:MAG: ATP-binding protein [Patescibacteria group bacterium]
MIDNWEPLREILDRIPVRAEGTTKNPSSDFASSTDSSYQCQKCSDIHFIHPRQDGKVDYSRLVSCECIRESLAMKKRQYLLRWCEFPSASEHMTFEKFKRTPALEEAYQAALAVADGSETRWLTLMGDTGCGKTHLAVAICRRWLSRDKLARFAYVPLLLEELKRGFGEGGDGSYWQRWDQFLHIPLLVLDDLGVEKPTEWVQERLNILADYRLMNGLPLVVTSNLRMEEVNRRIASRLDRGGRVVTIDSPPYRAEARP